MKSWILSTKLPVVLVVSVLFLTTSVLVLYFLFGHWLIETMYQGKSITALNRLITGQKYHTVNYYLDVADAWIIKYALYALVVCLFLLIPLNGKLLLGSTIASVILIEGGLRTYNSLYAPIRNDVTDEALLWESDPILGWKHAANSEGIFVSKNNGFRVQVKINSKGLRDDEYPYEKVEGISRVLLLGDSMLAGFEVVKEELIDSQLERLLNRNRKYRKYEVINAGVRGYGTDQSYLFLKTEGHKYSPDIIIYVFVGNDPQENITIHKPGRMFGKSYFMLDDSGQLVLKGVPVPHEFDPHDKWLMSDSMAQEYYNQAQPGYSKFVKRTPSILQAINDDFHALKIYKLVRSLFNQKNKQLVKPEYVKMHENRILRKLIERVGETARTMKAEFLVYEITNGLGPFPSVPTDLGKICDELGIDYSNAFKEFYEISGGGRAFVFPIDGHWNAKGHKVAAESVYRVLMEKKVDF